MATLVAMGAVGDEGCRGGGRVMAGQGSVSFYSIFCVFFFLRESLLINNPPFHFSLFLKNLSINRFRVNYEHNFIITGLISIQ